MDAYKRHQRIWRSLYVILRPWISRKFNLSHEDLHVDGPVLLISNHVTTWDPLLVAMSLREKQVYYVASEHIFRLGFVTKLLDWTVAPIARRKGSVGTDTVKACLRHLRDGRSVCIFAEGEQTWDGLSQKIFPATGKLAKTSGASLVTFRLEGGYLSLPRWGRGVRRGRMYCHPVNIYSPEQLRAMSPAEINDAINRDIFEDAWQRQAADPVAFRGKKRAEGMERTLYLCPGCRKIGTLQTKNDRLFCSCGLDLCYTETGFFEPDTPFRTIAEWEAWQKNELLTLFGNTSGLLFSDDDTVLKKIGTDHGEEELERGELRLYDDRLCCGSQAFPLHEISSMAIVKDSILLFSSQDIYYEIRTMKSSNLRKYLEIWKEKQHGLLSRKP